MTVIYFAGSIRGGRGEAELYGQIIEYLKEYGKVLTDHTGGLDLAKVVVAEVTTHDLGVGFEIGKALERNEWINGSDRKKILCLYRPSDGKRLSAMIAGCEGLTVGKYAKIEEARRHIDDFFRK
ncbi:MAG TPA: nucleoside 2-deoxyribosyltransferase [Candidatus Pacearchaeota archaeon]|nr:nucleoside 2-deoxyribosyltransferase [Candidatus Pacearchaeota archaeon]